MNISTGVKQALILAVGIIAMGESVRVGLGSLAGKDRKVVVKGLAEKEVEADKVTWPILSKEIGDDLPELYQKINVTTDIIRTFLLKNGLKQSEIDKAGLAGYDEWRVFTMEQINDLQRLNTDNMTSSLDLSYKLLCPGFSRGSKNMSAWKTVTFGQLTNGGMRFGLEKAYNLTPKTSSDDFDCGNSF